MALIINMPQLSDTMEEGRILQWLKSEGDELAVGDIIAEIESDKADVEFEVFRPGVLHKVLVAEGDVAPVGAPIAIVGAKDEDISEALAEAQEQGAEAAEKVAAEVAEKEEEAKERAKAEEAARAKVKAQEKEEAARRPDEKIKASPVALRLAAELGVDLKAVEGTGPDGRIVKRDVEAASKAAEKEAAPAAVREAEEEVAVEEREPAEAVAEKEAVEEEEAPPKEAPPAEDFEEVPMTGMRKAIARRLVESMGPVPHFYVTAEVDMSNALEGKEALERLRDVKVTVTDLVVKACGLALIKHPQINSSYQGDVIRRYNVAHVGIVVAMEEGLVIPVVRNAHAKGLAEIAKERADLVERGRARKLKSEEYQGATFTVSNLGMHGVEQFTAVISPPEGAVLSVGSVRERPLTRDGHLGVSDMMSITLGSDHRIIDGTAAASFLNEVRELLENPVSLLL